VVHSRYEEGYGTNHEINSPKISDLDDNGAVLVRYNQA